MSVISPRLAETNVSQADRTPREESSKTRKRKQPIKDDGSLGAQTDISNNTTDENGNSGREWTTGSINVAEESRCVPGLSERAESTRSTVDTRVTDGNDGDENDKVHETVITLEPGVLGCDDEGRGGDVDEGVATEETLIGGVDEETDEQETDNVEEGDTPEDLLDGSWEGFGWVLRFGSCETDEFGS